MDRWCHVVRNSGVNPRTAEIGQPTTAATSAEGVLVDVVVLSEDFALYQAARDAIGERNPVWRARTVAESVDLLLTGRCGVLMLDMGAVSTQPASLVEQIVDQFPDVVVVVAGRRDDETLLAPLVRDGLVYRFMHKPLSPKRAGMFLHAAIHAHAVRRDGRGRALGLSNVGARRSPFDPRKSLFVGGGVALFVAVLATVLVARHENRDGRPPIQKEARPVAAPVPGPLADPVLSSARAARAAGRYEAPPGRNALDLYAAVLLARPDNAEARAGLDATAALLVERAEAAAASSDAAEARRLSERVLSAVADHAKARELLARIDASSAPEPPMMQRVPPVAPSPAPASAPAPRAVQRDAPVPPPVAAQARTPEPRTVRVTPDPLTPRIIAPPPGSRSMLQAGRSRSFGAPITSGHAVAGNATSEPALPRVVPPAPPDSGIGPAIPARDLAAIATAEPIYPPQAFRDRIAGWAEVEFTVNESGTTGDIVVVAAEPSGVFDAAAIEAVAAWHYLPRVVNGQPVAQRTSVTLRFSVED